MHTRKTCRKAFTTDWQHNTLHLEKMESNDKLITMLGFARRAGKLVYGLDCLKSARGVKLLVLSDSAADNLKRNIERLADERELALVYVAALEDKVGYNVKALGLTDPNMAKAVTEYVQAGGTQYTIKYGKRR